MRKARLLMNVAPFDIVDDEAAAVGVLLGVHVLEGDVALDEVVPRRLEERDAARPGATVLLPLCADDAVLEVNPRAEEREAGAAVRRRRCS